MFLMDHSQLTMPPVPLTLEGSYVLHQMLRVRWREWKALPASERAVIVAEAADVVGRVENPGPVQSAVFSLLGHKGDLMVVHFRESLDALNRIELALAQLRLWDFLELTTSYLSVVELGLYESTVKTYQVLLDRNIEPHSPEWDRELADVIERQSQAMHARLYPEIPSARYICFYPMDRKRGETKNFYKLPITERQRQMHEHGMVGRRYAGTVKQIITGSIGFDDWEWGVDLFADDPLVFKKLIYEMRFDEVSAEYALFGSFFVGLRCPASALGLLLSGDGPKRPS
jgi:hydrogen peroxide-dependent heme synthase